VLEHVWAYACAGCCSVMSGKTITIDDLGAAAAFYLQCCLGLTDRVFLLHVS